MRLALFGMVLGNDLSVAVRILTILVSAIIVLGLWKRVWIAAIAYALTNMVGVLASVFNYIRLHPVDFQTISGLRAEPLPMTYLALYVTLIAILTFAVVRQRDYFAR